MDVVTESGVLTDSSEFVNQFGCKEFPNYWSRQQLIIPLRENMIEEDLSNLRYMIDSSEFKQYN